MSNNTDTAENVLMHSYALMLYMHFENMWRNYRKLWIPDGAYFVFVIFKGEIVKTRKKQ